MKFLDLECDFFFFFFAINCIIVHKDLGHSNNKDSERILAFHLCSQTVKQDAGSVQRLGAGPPVGH